MLTGKTNIAAGLLFLAGFMVFGFVLVYLRDFAPGKEQWIADFAVGKHFESRMSHVHGNLFALINVAVGLILMKLPLGTTTQRWVSGLALAGMLMPLGILAEVLFGAPPYLVLLGGLSMTAAMVWLGLAVWGARQ